MTPVPPVPYLHPTPHRGCTVLITDSGPLDGEKAVVMGVGRDRLQIVVKDCMTPLYIKHGKYEWLKKG